MQRPDQGQTDFTGKFDANGNQVVFEHLASVAWDFRNNLSNVVVIDRTSDVDDAEYYVYDAAGQRVRKVTHRLIVSDTSYDVEDKIYLGNVEVKKITRMVKVDGVYVPSPDYDMQSTSMHVMDDKNRIAISHFWHIDDDEREVTTANLDTNKVRYQYGNHLGSASLELDATANVISYEEYFPYGGTSFMYGPNQTEVKLKEYRYSAKERDDTTSFYYYGARYYAPWLCRWCSPDPAGPVDGPNLYWFVRGNPVGRKDKTGNNTTLPDSDYTVEMVNGEPVYSNPNDPGGATYIWADGKTQTFYPAEASTSNNVPWPDCPPGQSTSESGGCTPDGLSTREKIELGAGAVSLAGAVCPIPYVGDAVALGADTVAAIANPSAMNIAAVGMDAAGLLIPGVPAMGFLTKGEKGAEAAAKLANSGGEVVAGGVKAANSLFGSLSHAEKYGVQAYDRLRTAVKGTALQAHHLLEKRFAKTLGEIESKMASIAVTKNEHQAFYKCLAEGVSLW